MRQLKIYDSKTFKKYEKLARKRNCEGQPTSSNHPLGQEQKGQEKKENPLKSLETR